MKTLTVAVAWNQRHYLPFGGCTPLYQGLIEPAPEGISLQVWDHVALQHTLADSTPTRQWLLAELTTLQARQRRAPVGGWTAEDRLLTQLLPGDIELFHSVPLPSLTRPFWLHIETMRSLFWPWLPAETPIEAKLPDIRAYYRQVLGSPWCLGVSSHLPETLQALNAFLDQPDIQSRLVSTPIGLPAPRPASAPGLETKTALSSPRFLFAVSASPESDFFSSGGHLVLRTWQALLAAGQPGILSMACARPSAAALTAAGVSSDFVEQQTGRSILWTQASRTELEALMAGSHVFLQPADSLCTADILRAMSLGCVPVIAAVAGSSHLLQDNLHGVVVGSAAVVTEPWQRPVRSAEQEQQLIEQLLQRIPQLMVPTVYSAVQRAAQLHSVTELCGKAFADNLWGHVRQRYAASKQAGKPAVSKPLRHCLLTADGLRRAFNGDARPQLRIYNGLYSVWSQGGYYLMLEGRPDLAAQPLSVLNPYLQPATPALVLAHSLADLQGKYLPQPAQAVGATPPPISNAVRLLSRLLLPFPRVHSRCSQLLRRYRDIRQHLRKRPLAATNTGPATPPTTEREDQHDAL